MAVEMGTTPGFIASMPRQLFEFEGRYRARSGAFWFNYDVSRDGLSFLMVEDLAAVETVFTSARVDHQAPACAIIPSDCSQPVHSKAERCPSG